MPCSIVRSAPPEKVSLPEVTTAPLIAASAATLSTSALSSSIASGVSTFIDRPGMSQVISATPSASSVETEVLRGHRLVSDSGERGKGIAVRRGVPSLRRVADAGLVLGDGEIDVGIVRALARRARADLEIDGVAVGAVDEMVAVGDAGLEAGGVARPEDRLAVVLDQRQLAFEHVDELVLVLVPVAQRRGRAGLQRRQVDAELVSPAASPSRLRERPATSLSCGGG